MKKLGLERERFLEKQRLAKLQWEETRAEESRRILTEASGEPLKKGNG